jgi:hypothetical protein
MGWWQQKMNRDDLYQAVEKYLLRFGQIRLESAYPLF